VFFICGFLSFALPVTFSTIIRFEEKNNVQSVNNSINNNYTNINEFRSNESSTLISFEGMDPLGQDMASHGTDSNHLEPANILAPISNIENNSEDSSVANNGTTIMSNPLQGNLSIFLEVRNF